MIKEYKGIDGLIQRVKSNDVDVVIDCFPPLAIDPLGKDSEPYLQLKRWPSRESRPLWVLVDVIPGDCIPKIYLKDQLLCCDLFIVKTEFWKKFYIEKRQKQYEYELQKAVKDKRVIGTSLVTQFEQYVKHQWDQEMIDYFSEHTILAGSPEYDQVDFLLENQKDIKEKYGIAPEQRIITYLPFPFHGSVYGLWAQLYANKFLFFRLLAIAQSRNVSALTYCFHKTNNDVFRELAAYCKRKNIYLIVKGKHSYQPSRAEKQLASKVILEEQIYPHVLKELLAISDCCVSSYPSTAIYESIVMKAFHISMDLPLFPYLELDYYFYFKGLFDFKHISNLTQPDSMINQLEAAISCKDTSSERTKFIEKYLGSIGQAGSRKFINTISYNC
ncbi:MAG: hypothetical protein D3906_02435 [Candidatus Electrothrix sp. AUS1_2]|nr:hypothetical protein [Candidatus Electrothrix sp. AUS1_2]